MDSITSIVGLIAAAFTSLSYIPQVGKALPRGSTSDLSFKMLSVLTSGLAMWVVYGVLKSDWVIIVANSVGAGLSGAVLLCKLRDLRSLRKEAAKSPSYPRRELADQLITNEDLSDDPARHDASALSQIQAMRSGDGCVEKVSPRVRT